MTRLHYLCDECEQIFDARKDPPFEYGTDGGELAICPGCDEKLYDEWKQSQGKQ